MARERVLITVKTYPTLSRKYGETVCTAGVREDGFSRTDLHFFLGTTQQFHFRAPNPWVIVGVFPLPHETQLELF